VGEGHDLADPVRETPLIQKHPSATKKPIKASPVRKPNAALIFPASI